MNDIEYMADKMHQHRQQYVLPRLEQRAMIERELSIIRREQQRPSYPRRLAEAIGGLMMSAGERLAGPAWHAALSNGVIAETASQPVGVRARGDAEIVDALAAVLATDIASGYEIDLAPSPSIGDGRFATNPLSRR